MSDLAIGNSSSNYPQTQTADMDDTTEDTKNKTTGDNAQSPDAQNKNSDNTVDKKSGERKTEEHSQYQDYQKTLGKTQLAMQRSVSSPFKPQTSEKSYGNKEKTPTKPPDSPPTDKKPEEPPKTKEDFQKAINAGKLNVQHLKDALKKGTDLSELDLRPLKELKGHTFEGGDKPGRFHSVKFPEKMENVTFKNMNLRNSGFKNTTLDNVKFMNSHLDTAYFRHANINKMEVSGGSANHLNFENSTLKNSKFTNVALRNTEFFDSTIDKMDFSKTDLMGTSFEKTKSGNMKIQNSKFDNGDMRGANMSIVELGKGNTFKNTKYTGGELFPPGFDPEAQGMKKSSLTALKDKISSEKLQSMQARLGSTIPGLRKDFKKEFTGAGQTVGYIDARKDHSHAIDVERRINGKDPYGGLAPDAKAEHKDYQRSKRAGSFNMKDTEDAFKNYIDTNDASFVKDVTDRLKEFDSSGKKYAAINVSLGSTRAGSYEKLQSVLEDQRYNKRNPKGEYQFPNIRKTVFGDLADKDSKDPKIKQQQMNRLADYYDKHLEKSERIKKTFEDYKNITQKLWDKGTPVVVGAGNDGKLLKKLGLESRKGADFNLLAVKGKVISVAASNTNGTPDDLTDDTIASLSSRGDGKKTNPTLAAPGENVAIYDKKETGTSFAAPYVTGLIALMKQAHPGYTSNQILEDLTQTTFKTKAPIEAQGAGMVNPRAAVMKAQLRALMKQFDKGI